MNAMLSDRMTSFLGEIRIETDRRVNSVELVVDQFDYLTNPRGSVLRSTFTVSDTGVRPPVG